MQNLESQFFSKFKKEPKYENLKKKLKLIFLPFRYE